MTFNEYQQLAQRTANTDIRVGKLINGMLGLFGESGECADLIKKHVFQGHGLDEAHLAEELGDVLWYIAETASGLGVNLETIAQNNIDKLRRRYPDGFDAQRSINREACEE